MYVLDTKFTSLDAVNSTIAEHPELSAIVAAEYSVYMCLDMSPDTLPSLDSLNLMLILLHKRNANFPLVPACHFCQAILKKLSKQLPVYDADVCAVTGDHIGGLRYTQTRMLPEEFLNITCNPDTRHKLFSIVDGETLLVVEHIVQPE